MPANQVVGERSDQEDESNRGGRGRVEMRKGARIDGRKRGGERWCTRLGEGRMEVFLHFSRDYGCRVRIRV